MTEPEYVYRKGQGWVVIPTRIFDTYCKSKVRLEERTPQPGELWFNIRRNGSWYKNGEPDYDGDIRQYLQGIHLSSLNRFPTAVIDSCTYFVVVPL